MKPYLIVDKHNDCKAHLISISDTGVVSYNQAIFSERLAKSKEGVSGHIGWYKFYPKDEVVEKHYKHGYQEYINEAYSQWECKYEH